MSLSINFICLVGVIGVFEPRELRSSLLDSDIPSGIDRHSLDSSASAGVIDVRFFAILSLNLAPSGSAITSSISRNSILCYYFGLIYICLVSSSWGLIVVRFVDGLNTNLLCVEQTAIASRFSTHSGASLMNSLPSFVYLVINRS